MPTKIEWAQEVWNPVTGCDPISAGCAKCYARRMARRLAGRYGYPGGDGFAVTLHPDRLDQPLRWRKPRRVFVCSMGDLFHADVDDNFCDRIWQVMGECPQHTFQLLTKRPEHASVDIEWWPRNIWLGATIESQKEMWRLEFLRQVPAAVRFVSVEPMLAPLILDLEKVDWVIAGAETGPGARTMNPAWGRDLLAQCRKAGVPFFFKKLGNVSDDALLALEGLEVREFPVQP